MRALLAASIGSLLLAAHAHAQASFPARSGDTGIIDVPDAEALGRGGGQMGVELRFDHSPGLRDDFGPLPLYVVAGVSQRVDLGLTMREWGQAGDARPAHVLFGAAAKLQLWRPDGALPGAALGVVFDRFNDDGVLGARLALSTPRGPFRVAAFGGAETRVEGDLASVEPTAGLAVSLTLGRRAELAAEALTGPRGENFGAALRWHVKPSLGISFGGNYFPEEGGYRVSIGLAFSQPPTRKVVPDAPLPTELPPEVVAGVPAFVDDRPRFRLRIPTAGARQLGAGARQHGPFTAMVAEAPGAPVKPADATGKAAAPGLDDLAAAQVRDQEALADAREKRVRAAGEQLDGREAAAAAEASRLTARERELRGLEQQIAVREERTVVRTPSQQQRQLEAIVAQFVSQERNLAAQEKSFVPALDAAEGRERAAAVREQEEGAEASRLASSASPGMPSAAQVELRKQVLAARSRKLAAMETRLLARGERIDATERQLRTRAERVDAWTQRLNTRLERLQLLEKLLEPARTPPPGAPKPADDKGAAAPPKDKPAFVMVVKAPTAVVKEGARAAPGGGAAATPGISSEKVVIAATVVMFPTPATPLSELDRETLDNIARLAAKGGGELLVWARAKDPSLIPEAERRAAELRGRAATAGPLEASRITTRVTMRPGAQGVDVVVSALRETAPSKEVPVAPAGDKLQSGESGKRQLRDAVQAAQPAIEACVGEHLGTTKQQRAEGVLKLSVSSRGQVTRVATAGGDLKGPAIEECLTRASADWAFPSADAEYDVDVPITVMRGGAK